jgi:hypothetical protein
VVDALVRPFGRQIAVLGEEVARDRACDAFEARCTVDREAAEEDRSVLVEVRVDLVSVRRCPFGELDSVDRGLDHEGQRPVGDRLRTDEFGEIDGLPACARKSGCSANRLLRHDVNRSFQLAYDC